MNSEKFFKYLIVFILINLDSTAKLLFNSLTESPVREEYAKNSEDIIFE